LQEFVILLVTFMIAKNKVDLLARDDGTDFQTFQLN